MVSVVAAAAVARIAAGVIIEAWLELWKGLYYSIRFLAL